MQSLAALIHKMFGTKIIYNSPLANAPDGTNCFIGVKNEIHLKKGPKKQRRGVFYEEIQHAFDHHAGRYKNITDNEHIHDICARELVKNPFLPTTPEHNAALHKQADIWQTIWKSRIK